MLGKVLLFCSWPLPNTVWDALLHPVTPLNILTRNLALWMQSSVENFRWLIKRAGLIKGFLPILRTSQQRSIRSTANWTHPTATLCPEPKILLLRFFITNSFPKGTDSLILDLLHILNFSIHRCGYSIYHKIPVLIILLSYLHQLIWNFTSACRFQLV